MSKLLIPFIDNKSIDYRYFARESEKKYTTYRTGIYPKLNFTKNEKCSKLSEYLLCYDEVHINLPDFLLLVDVMGIELVEEYVRQNAIHIYYDGGIKAGIFSFSEDDPLILHYWLDRETDLDKVVHEYSRILKYDFSSEILSSVGRLASDSRMVDVNGSWIERLNKEIQIDLKNENLINNLKLINDGKIVDRDHDYNQILFNRIAYMNYFLSVGKENGYTDISLPNEIHKLIDAKLGGYLKRPQNELNQSFSKITIAEGIADIPQLMNDGALNFEDILKIRNNKKSIDFRHWLSSNQLGETTDIVELYNQANLHGTILNRAREGNITKTFKFAVPNLIGLIPILGAPISTLINTSLYMGEMINNNYKPKTFINDHLGKIANEKMFELKMKNEKNYFIKQYGSIGRNDFCPCGSELKFKKCHGKY